MGEEFFEIKDSDIDVKEIMEDIEAKVSEKKQAGVYDKYNLEMLTELQIEQLNDDKDLLEYYIRAVKRSWDVDINDFDIPNKGGILGKPMVMFKTLIWKCLKFYTYRLFSQQREFNSQMVSALEGLSNKIDSEVKEIKQAISEK